MIYHTTCPGRVRGRVRGLFRGRVRGSHDHGGHVLHLIWYIILCAHARP